MRSSAFFGLAILAAGSVSACSSITEGTHQAINLQTSPAGADCKLTRHGEFVGEVASTPGSIDVDKTKYDLAITCSKDGYQPKTVTNKSDVASATVGNALIGGLIGWGIDSATGADNKYDGTVSMVLEPKS